MRGLAIDTAEEKDRIVGIHRIVPEVEESDFDTFCQKEKSGDERFDFCRRIPLSSNFSANSAAMSSVTSQLNSRFAQRLMISLFGLAALGERSAARTTLVSRTARSMIRGLRRLSFRPTARGSSAVRRRGRHPPCVFRRLWLGHEQPRRWFRGGTFFAASRTGRLPT